MDPIQTVVEKKTILIIGLPNTGKSHLFNSLTGEYTLVGNYPFTTIETKRSACKIGKEPYEIIDTPGLHGLYIHSEEELVVRDLLLSERPDALIQCIDANRLKQSLSLTADLLELGIPMVISLNAIDEASGKGIRIDSDELSRLLGVPVVESVDVNSIGSRELVRTLKEAVKGRWTVWYGDILEAGISDLESIMPDDAAYKRKLATLLLLNDPYLLDFLKNTYDEKTAMQLADATHKTRGRFQGNPASIVNRRKNDWIDDIAKKVVRRKKGTLGGFSEVFARLSRHPVFGVPILLAIIFIMYFLVVNVANEIAGWMDETLWAPIEHFLSTRIPSEFLKDFLIGDYGILSLGLANAFLTVLPILTVFFLASNILEDIGYIPNLSVLTKRLFEKIGLSGAAIMPLVLGFGCKTMATLSTRSLRSKRERYIAIYLIAFSIPCAAQMGLNMSILGLMGVSAFIIAFSVLVFVEIMAGVILNLILKKEERCDFIQELPPIRLPSMKAVLKKTYYRIYWFLKEAVPVFMYAALVLFVIDWIGLLDAFKNAISPVMIGLLGLPLEMVDALILCMARHEAAAGLIINLVNQGKLDYMQCIVAVTITTMFVPCFANIMAMIKELGAVKAITMAAVINVSAFLIAGALHWTLVWFL